MRFTPSAKAQREARHLLGLTFLCAIILGCAGTTKKDSLDNRLNDGHSLPSHWQVKGKLAIRPLSPGDKKNNQTLRFEWSQVSSNYSILFAGPLGFGTMIIEKDANRVTLTRGKKYFVSADSVEELFFQQTGWHLPLSHLRHWVLGQASPDSSFSPIHSPPHNTLNVEEQLASFEQQGWTVQYPKSTWVNTHLMPKKMIVSNDNFKLIIAFKNWQLAPAPELASPPQ